MRDGVRILKMYQATLWIKAGEAHVVERGGNMEGSWRRALVRRREQGIPDLQHSVSGQLRHHEGTTGL